MEYTFTVTPVRIPLMRQAGLWDPTSLQIRASSLMVNDLRPETKGSRFESGHYLSEVNSL